jgi:archaellum component FlaF (FlaF/FlaG flagellin family)
VIASTCSTLDVTLSSYGAGTTNYVTVTIDDVVVENHTQFGNSFPKTSYAMTSSTTAHTYKVEIDAQHNAYDKLGAAALTGSWMV